MGYMYVTGNCVCGKLITFNASKVPSISVPCIDGTGRREPLCRSCFDRWNQIHRISKGLEPVALNPEAYEAEEI